MLNIFNNILYVSDDEKGCIHLLDIDNEVSNN